ncbi:class I adenylate-forming enzyme family protein [Belnapia moabensis]|uniref:class I adenylate-forming enzyme family protein n=1 Tax=Belnapia moabensis TaxID=365533 RepID=UPI00146FF861|nr:AMP-binding protein [Belnapia moabensis]
MMPGSLVVQAQCATIGGLFRETVRQRGDAPALEGGSLILSYRALSNRVNRAANLLAAMGVSRGDRVAVIAENRREYPELLLALALRGAILAAQNWRLAGAELQHCLNLVTPRAVFASPRHAEKSAPLTRGLPMLRLGPEYEAALERASDQPPPDLARPDDPLLILFTSGTTGVPKGAVISHRTEVSRSMLRLAEFGLPRTAVSAVWAPLYHMAGIEEALSTLLYGGHAMMLDGFDAAGLAGIVGAHRLGWLRLMPGMIGPLVSEMRERCITPRGMTLCGTMADLVPAHQIAEVTALLGAPYVNSFGSTETGMAPCSIGLVPIGVVPSDLAKTQTSFCELRLVDAEDGDVAEGEAGEAAVRGPTLFSGYWNAPDATAHDFRGGWFHMGDMFRRRADGKLQFVDRVKYLIKSGGENVYPAEIERVILADPRVADAVVVRQSDPRWGEVPIAVVARKSSDLDAEALRLACRAALAGYKQPKGIRFVPLEALPRSTTGKIQRHEVERALAEGLLPEEETA